MVIYLILMVAFSCLTCLTLQRESGTHFVLSDNKVRLVKDSFFQLKDSGDLCGFLEQEKVYEKFIETSLELVKLKKKVEEDEENESDSEDIKQKIYKTDPNCIFSLKPLYQYDLYTGTVVFAYEKTNLNMDSFFDPPPTTNELFYSFNDLNVVIRSSTNTCSTNITNTEIPDERLKCENFCTISEKNFGELSDLQDPNLSSSLKISIEREDCILERIGWKKNVKEFQRFLLRALNEKSSQWNIYLLGSFYWRYFGRQSDALTCARRAYELAPNSFRSIVILSAATILQRSNALQSSILLLERILQLEPDNSFAHYQLGNIKSILGEYSLAVEQFNHVLNTNPNFVEAKLRKSAVLCHESIENALHSQHEILKNTLKNLKDFNSKSSLVDELYDVLRAKQQKTELR